MRYGFNCLPLHVLKPTTVYPCIVVAHYVDNDRIVSFALFATTKRGRPSLLCASPCYKVR